MQWYDRNFSFLSVVVDILLLLLLLLLLFIIIIIIIIIISSIHLFNISILNCMYTNTSNRLKIIKS